MGKEDLRQFIRQKKTQLPARKERSTLGPEVMINEFKWCKYIFSTFIFCIEGPAVERSRSGEVKEPSEEKLFKQRYKALASDLRKPGAPGAKRHHQLQQLHCSAHYKLVVVIDRDDLKW